MKAERRVNYLNNFQFVKLNPLSYASLPVPNAHQYNMTCAVCQLESSRKPDTIVLVGESVNW